MKLLVGELVAKLVTVTSSIFLVMMVPPLVALVALESNRPKK